MRHFNHQSKLLIHSPTQLADKVVSCKDEPRHILNKSQVKNSFITTQFYRVKLTRLAQVISHHRIKEIFVCRNTHWKHILAKLTHMSVFFIKTTTWKLHRRKINVFIYLISGDILRQALLIFSLYFRKRHCRYTNRWREI